MTAGMPWAQESINYMLGVLALVAAPARYVRLRAGAASYTDRCRQDAANQRTVRTRGKGSSLTAICRAWLTAAYVPDRYCWGAARRLGGHKAVPHSHPERVLQPVHLAHRHRGGSRPAARLPPDHRPVRPVWPVWPVRTSLKELGCVQLTELALPICQLSATTKRPHR